MASLSALPSEILLEIISHIPFNPKRWERLGSGFYNLRLVSRQFYRLAYHFQFGTIECPDETRIREYLRFFKIFPELVVHTHTAKLYLDRDMCYPKYIGYTEEKAAEDQGIWNELQDGVLYPKAWKSYNSAPPLLVLSLRNLKTLYVAAFCINNPLLKGAYSHKPGERENKAVVLMPNLERIFLTMDGLSSDHDIFTGFLSRIVKSSPKLKNLSLDGYLTTRTNNSSRLSMEGPTLLTKIDFRYCNIPGETMAQLFESTPYLRSYKYQHTIGYRGPTWSLEEVGIALSLVHNTLEELQITCNKYGESRLEGTVGSLVGFKRLKTLVMDLQCLVPEAFTVDERVLSLLPRELEFVELICYPESSLPSYLYRANAKARSVEILRDLRAFWERSYHD